MKDMSLQSAGHKRRVLIIGADGLRPDQVTPEKMPTYCELMKKGTRFRSFHSAYPSETRVCMATFTTGVYPGKHGVVGNLMYVPGFSEDGRLETGNHQHIMQYRNMLGEPFVLRPTLGDRLHEANKRLSVSAGSSPGASLIWNLNDPGRILNPSTDYGIDELNRILERYGPVPPEGNMKAARGERTSWITRVFIDRHLPDERNDVMVLWLPEPDNSQHFFGVGSAVAEEAHRLVDRCVADVLAAIAHLGIEDRIDLLLVSDHGHSTGNMVGRLSDYLAMARNALMLPLPFVAVGPHIYGDEQHVEELAALAGWLQKQPWCSMVAAKPPLDRLLSGVVPLDAMLGTITHNRAPLLAVVPTWSDEVSGYGVVGLTSYLSSKANVVSSHGSIRNDDMRPFCVGCGPSFREGHTVEVPAGIVDIAPTVCHLLGLPQQEGFDGRVLTEALREGEEQAEGMEVSTAMFHADAGRTKGLKVASVNGTKYIVDCFG